MRNRIRSFVQLRASHRGGGEGTGIHQRTYSFWFRVAQDILRQAWQLRKSTRSGTNIK